MTANTEWRFVSREFTIIRATLSLFGFEFDPAWVLKSAGGDDITERDLLNNEGSLSTVPVTRGVANVVIARPGVLQGKLVDMVIERSDGRTLPVALCEFTHDISEAEIWSQTVTVDLSAFGEVVIKVRDPDGRPLPSSMVSFYRLNDESGSTLSLASDEHGEIVFLLPPARYAAKVAGVRAPSVQFEIEASGKEPVVVELTSPR